MHLTHTTPVVSCTTASTTGPKATSRVRATGAATSSGDPFVSFYSWSRIICSCGSSSNRLGWCPFPSPNGPPCLAWIISYFLFQYHSSYAQFSFEPRSESDPRIISSIKLRIWYNIAILAVITQGSQPSLFRQLGTLATKAENLCAEKLGNAGLHLLFCWTWALKSVLVDLERFEGCLFGTFLDSKPIWLLSQVGPPPKGMLLSSLYFWRGGPKFVSDPDGPVSCSFSRRRLWPSTLSSQVLSQIFGPIFRHCWGGELLHEYFPCLEVFQVIWWLRSYFEIEVRSDMVESRTRQDEIAAVFVECCDGYFCERCYHVKMYRGLPSSCYRVVEFLSSHSYSVVQPSMTNPYCTNIIPSVWSKRSVICCFPKNIKISGPVPPWMRTTFFVPFSLGSYHKA